MKKINKKYIIILMVFIMLFCVNELHKKGLEHKFENPPENVLKLIENFYTVNPEMISVGKYYDVKPVAIFKAGDKSIFLEVVCKEYNAIYYGGTSLVKELGTDN